MNARIIIFYSDACAISNSMKEEIDALKDRYEGTNTVEIIDTRTTTGYAMLLSYGGEGTPTIITRNDRGYYHFEQGARNLQELEALLQTARTSVSAVVAPNGDRSHIITEQFGMQHAARAALTR